MQKLVFPFVKIDLPDDFPSGFDPEAVSEYLEKHPDVANKIVQEYEQAYWKAHRDNTCQGLTIDFNQFP